MDEELKRHLATGRRVLLSVRWLLLAAPLLGGALGLAAARIATPKYVSSITVSLKDQEVFNNLLKDIVAPENTKTSTGSAKALLETAPVLERVALHARILDSTSGKEVRFAVRQRLLKSFKVQQSGSESGLFTITCTAPSAEEARDVADAFGREFLRETASLRTRTARLAMDYLRDQMDKTGAQLEAKRKAAAEYRAKNIFSLPDFALDGTINLLQLRKEQIETSAKLAQARKRIELIRDYYRKSDPELSSMKAELARILAEHQRLKGDFTEQHPIMKELRFKQRQIERLIAAHKPGGGDIQPRDRITLQLAADGKPTYSANPGDAFLLGRQFQEQDLLLEQEMLQARLSQLDSLLDGLKGGLEQIPELQRTMSEQQVEIDRLQKTYDDIRNRWSDAQHSIEISNLDVSAEFSVASAATLPDRPIYPVPAAFILAGSLLALVSILGLGVARIWWRGLVRDVVDLETDLGLPCLGTLPDMRRKEGRR